LASERAAWFSANPGFVARCVGLFAETRDFGITDADGDLYGGFINDADRRLFPRIRTAEPSTLSRFANKLQDERLKTLLFRYQARNWPATLDAAQRAEWDAFRSARLLEGDQRTDGTRAAFEAEWHEALERATTVESRAALTELQRWRDALMSEIDIN
jgi:exodeoxyribonuclease-1